MTDSSIVEPGWAHRWRSHLEQSGIIDASELRAGDAYRRNDPELDLLVENGRLTSTAGRGRRVSHDVVVTFERLSPEERAVVWHHLASSPAAVAGILDGRLSPDVVEGEPGSRLLPRAGEVHWTCGCTGPTSDVPAALCRHVAAVIEAFGHHLEREPLDLAILRGAPPGELNRALMTTAVADDTDPGTVWSAPTAPFPPRLRPPAEPTRRPPFPSEPPASAPFSAEGLRQLSDRAAERAWRALTDPSSPSLGLEADAGTDLARLAAETNDPTTKGRLAASAGLTNQEVAARARAWEVAGSPGIDVQHSPGERCRIDDRTEYRQGPDGLWYRFEKIRGRWWLAEPGRDALPPEATTGNKDGVTD